MTEKILIMIILIASFLTWPASINAQENNMAEEANIETLDSDLYYFYNLDGNTRTEVGSLFVEDELFVGSTVSSVTPEKWKMLGAKRYHEALSNELSVVTYPLTTGAYGTAIRGYAMDGVYKGIATLIDGVPATDFIYGCSNLIIPNWELGTLNRIEIIKGPGSAIYGSDAFHGVISLKTFESDKDMYSIEGAGAYPLYGDTNVKISQGLADNILRTDFSAAASYQGEQNLEYEYNDPEGYDHDLMPGGHVVIPPDKGTSERDYKYNSETVVFKIRFAPLDSFNASAGFYLNRGNYNSFPALVSTADFDATTNYPLNTQESDLSGSDTLFWMIRSALEYVFSNKISVETSAYYWDSEKDSMYNAYSKKASTTAVAYAKDYDTRDGIQITIKQPDNPLRLQWLLAFSYSKLMLGLREEKAVMSTPGSPAPDTMILSKESGETRDIKSGFAQIKWGVIKDRLFLIAGGRDDYYSDFGNQITPRGGIIFLPAGKSSIKALYGRAFRAPTFLEKDKAGAPGVVKGNENLKPEIIDVYELDYIYKGKKWKTSANFFYSKWTNAIVNERLTEEEQSVLYSYKYSNSGKNDSIGSELSFLYSSDPYSAELGFSYVRSRAIDIEAPEDPSKTVNRVYGAFPEYSIIAGLGYILKPVGISFNLNNIVYLNMREWPDFIKPHPDMLPPYYRMDLCISKIFSGNFELYLNVRNILNRENRMPSFPGAENGYVEPGIGVMLRAGYKL